MYLVGAKLQVGEAGLAQSVGNFKNTAYDLKRVLGKSWGDQDFEQDVSQLAYKVSKGDQGQTQVPIDGLRQVVPLYAGMRRNSVEWC
jgi:molecular chaperone DnaK (HSP70)